MIHALQLRVELSDNALHFCEARINVSCGRVVEVVEFCRDTVNSVDLCLNQRQQFVKSSVGLRQNRVNLGLRRNHEFVEPVSQGRIGEIQFVNLFLNFRNQPTLNVLTNMLQQLEICETVTVREGCNAIHGSNWKNGIRGSNGH